MIFRETVLGGAWIVELEPQTDERGFFARTFCEREFATRGLADRFVQASVSVSPVRGTLRGMHYQLPPNAEAKLVRCTAGRVFDVIVDLRPASKTQLAWTAVELSAQNRRALYVPEGFGHGLLTLEDDCEVAYQMAAAFAPASARGFRFDDPRVGIQWPAEPRVISERDRGYPDLDPAELEAFRG